MIKIICDDRFTCYYSNLKPNETFITEPCLNKDEVYLVLNDLDSFGRYMSVNLKSGSIRKFEKDTLVEQIDIEMRVIKNS